MKRLPTLIAIAVFVSASAGFTEQALAGGPKFLGGHLCYKFDNFPTDFLILKITPGLGDVRGRYRQCVEGAVPGTGSVDALMTGSIQHVAESSTIPFAPFTSTIKVQMSLAGSLATGNLGGGDLDKFSRCYLHAVFQDPALTTGQALAACEWWSGSVSAPPFETSDRSLEPITKISCSQVLTLGPAPGASCSSLLP